MGSTAHKRKEQNVKKPLTKLEQVITTHGRGHQIVGDSAPNQLSSKGEINQNLNKPRH